jgi:hypothetical protein
MHKYAFHRTLAMFALAALALAALPNGRALAAPQPIYADSLATGWADWSFTTHDLQATAPIHSGSKSISVTYGAWQGLFLHHPGVATAGFTKLTFFIHGGAAGGQKLQLYATRASDTGGNHGPDVTLPQPAANTWIEVQVPLADLGAAGATITGLTWHDTTGGAQPTLYIDDIALASDESPDGPALSAGGLLPRAARADGATGVVVQARVTDPQGPADIASVTVDAAALGRGTVALRDDGRSNDGAAADGLYGAGLTVAPGTATGEQQLLITARDQAGHQASLSLGAFEVLGPAGGAIPTALPQRIGWGTNAWSETAGQDWQVNSGVPWDYDYQYITWGWEGWGPNFVTRFVSQAWSKNYIPVISVYMVLGVPPSTGEGPAPYAAKLQNATTVSDYLASVARAAAQAKGAKPVIFHIEPDFYGFMQAYKYSTGASSPDDPSSYPVALNVTGYPNNLAGFGRRIVDLIHATAPNALVAPHASMWATNGDPNNIGVAEATSVAQRTAAFIRAMGGDQADLWFVEWSDRDSGSGLRPWWDDTDLTLPRPTRAILWEGALSAAAGKRLMLWQVPCGNMSLDNTPLHYQDNRPAYAFSHPRELADAGVIGVLFGGGDGNSTEPSTDGGFIAAHGAIAYAPPAAPSGLAISAVTGPTVALYWNPNGEEDLWGYRISYQPIGGGPVSSTDVVRATQSSILLPRAGSWRITIAAYDAMGRLGPSSAAVTATTTSNASQVMVPLVQR